MTNESRELLRDCCEEICLSFRSLRRSMVSDIYHFLGRFSYSVSSFYVFIVDHTTGKGKINNLLWRHNMLNACKWLRRALKYQYLCRTKTDECSELLAKCKIIHDSVAERISIVKPAG